MRMDRNDVCVLEPGQRLWLARAAPGDLQRHRPVSQLPLIGQENSRKGASAQFFHEIEAADGLAGAGKKT